MSGEERVLRCTVGRFIQSELKGSHLLLAWRPPSFLLNVLLYGRHWGLSWWRLVQSLYLHVTARPVTKAPVTALLLTGSSLHGGSQWKNRPTPHVPQPLLRWVRRLRASLTLYGL